MVTRTGRLGRGGLLALVALSLVVPGCAARKAYQQGMKESKKGNWDEAVARLTLATQESPDNIQYKIALENARVQASRFHSDEARKAQVAQDLDKAAEELEIATKYDPGNKSAADDLFIVRAKIRKREEDKQRQADFEAMRSRSQQQRLPLPVLSPRSPVPITLKFSQTSLQSILDTLAKLAGVNILYDQDYRDKKTDVTLSGVTFQEALDRITFVNRLFYKVLDQNTLIVIPETPAKRRTYDEQVLRTFYLQNADAQETLNLVKTLSGITKALANKELQSITVLGTPDKVALAERVVLANDKAKGEVMIEIQILNVNSSRVKQWGLTLSAYTAGVTFAPFSDPSTGTESAGALTSVRAHLLSSFNLADFVVSVPSTIFTRFLQSESNTRILAAPRLRAAEGKKTSLKIGTEVPVPVTTFQATQTGGTTFSPATSFQYRNVGVNLDVTPKVNPAGDITLELTAEFSLLGAAASFSEDGPSLPTFLTRNVTGVLRLRDGETSLIGGLLQREENESFQGIIGLQSIPVLNKIFTSVSKTPQDTEILISITPHILRAPKVIDEDLAGLVVGTEEIPRVEGARPPLFGPLIEAPPPGGAAGRGTATASPGVPPRPATSVPPAAPPPVPAAPPANVPSAPPSTPLSQADETAAVPGVSGATSSPDPTRLTGQLLPSEALVKVGDAVTVSLVVVGLQDVSSLDAVLTFESSIEVVEATAGSLLTLDGTPVGTERAFEAGRARVKLTKATATSGSGAVLSLRLRGVAPGTATLAVESLSVSAAGVEKSVSVSTSRVVVNP